MLNVQSIPQRLAMSLSTIVAVAMAVAVLLGFLALSNGFRATMAGTGAEDIAIINRKGATSELSSIISSEQVTLLEAAPGLRAEGGAPLVSPELYLIVDGVKRSTGTSANMPLRGITETGVALRQNATITEGRIFTPGTNEIVVGRGLLREFAGFELGKDVKLGANTWRVVGVFDAPGTVFESELWADAHVVQSLFNRGSSVQIVRAALTSPAAIEAFRQYNDDDPRLQLEVRTERDFYASQSEGMSDLIGYIGWPLGIVMAIGALAGALNTMYSSVAARAGEIATLRIIGFSGFAAFVGTLVEALALSAIGALVGALFCFIFFNGMSASTMGGNFTQVVFKLQLSPELIWQALIMALIIGLIGGFFPGLRAASTRPQLELAAQ